MTLFRQRTPREEVRTGAPADFEYLDPAFHYFDSACQTIRPKPVMAAMTEYFERYNACGGRVKYAWGEKVDGMVGATRARLLGYLAKSPRDYTAAFTLNTTAGVNLLLQQLPTGRYRRIVTSEIEHNSVFLPTQTCARRLGMERLVLTRTADGSLDFTAEQLERAVVVVNSTSNIDGRVLGNLAELVKAAHERGGIVIVDAAQTMGHGAQMLRGVAPDAICGSAHKMYGPSLGFIVVRKALLDELDFIFLGGGTVSDVRENDFDLLNSPDEPYARLEPGLQDFAGIAGFGAAIGWLDKYRPEGEDACGQQAEAAKAMYEPLVRNERLKFLNRASGPILSFHSTKVDSHRLALYLSAQNIMVRSGHFCCHYYLEHVAKVPPQIRISIGLNNTVAEAGHIAGVIEKIVNNL